MRGSASPKPEGGRAKKSGRVMSTALAPFRSVMRTMRLTTWTTSSGPTATYESGGSTGASLTVSLWIPSNVAIVEAGAAVVVASTGGLTVTVRGATALVFGALRTGRIAGWAWIPLRTFEVRAR